MATIIDGRKQYQSVFTRVWQVSETINFADAATGSGTFASAEVTVPGVALGDIVMGVSAGVDTIDAVIGGAVTAADTVTLTLLNNTTGSVNLASTTVRFVVARMSI